MKHLLLLSFLSLGFVPSGFADALLCPEYITSQPNSGGSTWTTTRFRSNFTEARLWGSRFTCFYTEVNNPQLFFTISGRGASCDATATTVITSSSSTPSNMSMNAASLTANFRMATNTATATKCYYRAVPVTSTSSYTGFSSNSTYSTCTISGRGAFCN